jgi:glycosyltransferase involved in cell wall biosynthesis
VGVLEHRQLLIIVPDALSALVRKGEIMPRYYNPGQFFEEVHIIVTNNDKVPPGSLQETVGEARLSLYNHPLPSGRIFNLFGYDSWALGSWAEAGVSLAKQIKPDIIRCYRNSYNAYLGARIKERLKIPLIVSLHNNPDQDLRGRAAHTFREKIRSRLHYLIEKPALKQADHFIAVYNSIVPYLKRNGVTNYSVTYNAVGYDAKPKTNYVLHSPARLLWVGLQLRFLKDPTHIVEAVSELRNVELTMVGTGNVHEELVQLAKTLKCTKCKFVESLPNIQVLQLMQEADIYVFNQEMLGISKTIMEAALTALPIVVNSRPSEDELSGTWLQHAENTKEGYLQALTHLLGDQDLRQKLGRSAYSYALANWAPEKMEKKLAETYRHLLERN